MKCYDRTETICWKVDINILIGIKLNNTRNIRTKMDFVLLSFYSRESLSNYPVLFFLNISACVVRIVDGIRRFIFEAIDLQLFCICLYQISAGTPAVLLVCPGKRQDGVLITPRLFPSISFPIYHLSRLFSQSTIWRYICWVNDSVVK